ncbi:MAG: DNA cytosine methyltransferase [Gammaproteobacteria bacterium]|nr:DNA cytosine methyltransferase [Gammaproteobacteria bacterium]
MRNRNAPTYISLFSGCGGFDIGMTKAGFKPLGAFDISPLALLNLSNNSCTPVYETDLSKNKLPSVLDQSPDVVISGSPCQGFSTIGKRSLVDPRNDLLIAGARIALQLSPKVFVAENVPGVTSGGHRIYWEEMIRILQKTGYQTLSIKLNAFDFGVSQRRIRMFLIAWKGAPKGFNLDITRGVSLRTALSGTDGLPNHDEVFLQPETKDHKIALRILPGQKLSNVRGGPRSVHTWDIPEAFGHITEKERTALEDLLRLRRRLRIRNFGDADPVERKLFIKLHGERTVEALLKKNYIKQVGDRIDLVGGFNGKYRRLEYDLPSCTVDTRFGSAKHFLHPELNRGHLRKLTNSCKLSQNLYTCE